MNEMAVYATSRVKTKATLFCIYCSISNNIDLIQSNQIRVQMSFLQRPSVSLSMVAGITGNKNKWILRHIVNPTNSYGLN